MTRDLPQTPTRRSQRHQPTATPSTSSHGHDILECGWVGLPIYVRKTNIELDCLPEETESQGERANDDYDELETVFYEEFKLKRKATSFRGHKRMKMSKAELHTYHIGSTIMVETDILDLRKRPPSIGVIVAMWQVRKKGDDVVEDPSKMRIRIHWFLRPSEMAAVRAKRQHEENEIYYCMSSRVIVTPSVILSRCAVSGIRNIAATATKKVPSPKYTYVPKTPTKAPATPSKSRVSSPLKKRTRFSPTSEDEEEDTNKEDDCEINNDPDKNFYCKLAVDSRRGVFYEFNWESHRVQSIKRTKPPTSTGSAGSSSSTDDPLTWGECSTWDVVEKSKKTDKATSKVKAKKKADFLPEDIPESEPDASDEYEWSSAASDDDADIDPDELDNDSDGERNDEEDDEDDVFGEPQTPFRKRGRGQDKTPRKRTKTIVQPTPHSKAALARRKRKKSGGDSEIGSPRKRKAARIAIRFPEQSLTFQASMAHLPKDPWLRAMHALHVGSRPDVLPCREEEYEKVLRSVGQLLEEGSGGCVYISGVPGTGKTATVHSVVKELKRMAENSETNPFTYVEINGLKIPEPEAAYNLLWEGVSGHDVAKEGHLRVSTKQSLKALMRHFSTGNRGPGGHACVVLMDELDQLVTTKQDVVYNFFNWPTLVGSKLVVIAVANTMDLPERAMTGRVRSRLGMTRINFRTYEREQLVKIVEARLASAKESLDEDERAKCDIISKDAIKLAAINVSRITGDARRILDICRRAVELVKSTKTTAKPPHVQEVLSSTQNTPTAAYLRDLSFHERLMLTSAVKVTKREGTELIKWGDVQRQHIIYMESLTSEEDSMRKPTPAELLMVLDSLVASKAVVFDTGVTAMRKHSDERMLFLNIEQGEVEKVLGDIGGTKWKNVLGN